MDLKESCIISFFAYIRCAIGVIFDNEYLESVYFIASKIIQQNKEKKIESQNFPLKFDYGGMVKE